MFDPKVQKPTQNIPPGAIPVGSSYGYPDMNGNIHKTPGEAIKSNQRLENDYSRGSSGGCGQNPDLIPPSKSGW